MAITYKDTKDSITAIDGILNPAVKEWFYSRFSGYSLPQQLGVLEIKSRNNILISAPTGATKTLTAFMAVLSELVDSSQKGILKDQVYALYISPLKALNYDIQVNLLEPLREIEAMTGDLGIRVAVRTGDTTPYERAKMAKKVPHILITTPESLAIMLNAPQFQKRLAKIEWCIIDEIHALADNKRGVHLSLSLERLERLAEHMTRIGLSATISPLESVAKYLVGTARDCVIIDVQFMKDLDLEVISPVPDLINTGFEEMQNKLYSTIHGLISTHKTTLIFTNTRAATERVVDTLKDRYPTAYAENIGAHHGSLSKEHRHRIEQSLREGKMKCVVCSTSLELGIDIGYIDLVILLGSPKSVARALQRCGRSGHRLRAKAKGRIIVLDRDDLVECAVLLKSALDRKIDTIHIPMNALDVLAQHIVGIALNETISFQELVTLIRKSYCYSEVSAKDVTTLLIYLSGGFRSLEERHIYARIWFDQETQMIGRKGKMSRMIYMTNIGTIPDETSVLVKIGSQVIGTIEESFLEKLRPGDVFVLGGSTYQFHHAKGMVAMVTASANRPPTVPRWYSESLPLSYDLAIEIGRFRRLCSEKLNAHLFYPRDRRITQEEVISFIHSYLPIDKKGAHAIYAYLLEQFLYIGIPTDKRIIIETYLEEGKYHYIFHSLYGRRVNDCLSRAVAFAVSRISHRDVEIGINDNGFVLASPRPVNAAKAFSFLKSEKLELVMDQAIARSEVYKRRFRHCAARSLMILRNYQGKQKTVGRQQVSSMILMNALKRIDPDFPILKEARREVLYDQMDIGNAKEVISRVSQGTIAINEVSTKIPSPFAFSLITQGLTEVLRIEDKTRFVQRMHQLILAKISMKEGSKELNMPPQIGTGEAFRLAQEDLSPKKKKLLDTLSLLSMSDSAKHDIRSLILGTDMTPTLASRLHENSQEMNRWPGHLRRFIQERLYAHDADAFSYETEWDDEETKKRNQREEENEQLLLDFRTAASKVALDPQIQYDIQQMIDDPSKETMRDETRSWIKGLLKGSIPKIWTDSFIRFLKSERFS